jgi:flagellar biosynthesis GTPase FlhF
VSSPNRTYRGRALDEVIPQIQRDLGTDAIIVRRREGLTGGFLGFFQRPFVEIEATAGRPSIDLYDEELGGFEPDPPAAAPEPALEPQPPPAPIAAPAPQSRAALAELEARLAQRAGAGQPLPPSARPPAIAPSTPAPGPAPMPFQPPSRPQPAAAGSAYVTAHLAALARADRSKLLEPLAEPERRREPVAPAVDFQELIPRESPRTFARAPVSEEYAAEPRRATLERRAVAPGSHTRARAGVEKSLRRLGISEQLACELIDGATAHTLPLAPHSGLAQAVRTTLAQRIPVALPLPTSGAAIVLVGAGGSGKTTCCATLLGAYRRSSTLPANCATLTHGPEQGDLQIVISPQIMKPTPVRTTRAQRALRKARRDGLSVLDTPAVSPADRAGIRDLAALLAELQPERVVVALPATLSAAAATQLLSALRPLGANALAVTHADETDQIGVAVEAACAFGLAPEYMLDRARAGGWRLNRIDPTGLAAKLLP